jgi:UDP-N-acetyl-D-mannosaminuronic acid dehydrogenase
MEPEEAELAKLFTNTWRYIKFATANQLYMIANNYGLDYDKIRTGLADGYPQPPISPAPASPPGRVCSRTRCSSPLSITTSSPWATRR